MALKLNQPAPNFTLPSTNGSDFVLDKTQLGKSCILYFYPKDFTPGCTLEACQFRDSFDHFKDLDIDIYGISTDSLESHLKFKKKHQLGFDLLADASGEVSNLYQAKVPFLGISKRITYLLDHDHKIADVYDNFFGAKYHMDKMKEAVKNL